MPLTQIDAGGNVQNQVLHLLFASPPGTDPALVSEVWLTPECPTCGEAQTATAVTGVAILQVPEPASTLLLGAPLAALYGTRRRRQETRSPA